MSVSADLPLSVTDGTTTPHVTMRKADADNAGYLSTADWSRFDGLASRIAALESWKATVEGNLCPRGWTAEVDNANPSNPIPHCRKTLPDGHLDYMVKVGDFWIDRWEMATCDGATDLSGQRTGYGTTALGCSSWGQEPKTNITWFQAQQMCANAGKRLCTNAEWQLAASGTPDPGPTGGAGPECNVTGGSTVQGAHPGCTSRFGVQDMIGGVWEWIADWAAETGWNGTGSTLASGATSYGSDVYQHGGQVSEPGVGSAGSHLVFDGTTSSRWPGAGLRGGSSTYGAGAGAFAASWADAPSHYGDTMGARCCIGRW